MSSRDRGGARRRTSRGSAEPGEQAAAASAAADETGSVMLATTKTFSALTEEFVECVMRHNPVVATEVGIHDYDHKLPDDSPDGFRERSAWLRDLEQRLVASVPWEELPAPQRIDYALLRSRIAAMRADLEEIKVHAHNPALFPEMALRGLYILMTRPF